MPAKSPISIDYLVHQAGSPYRIRDIVTEGSSLVTNYHQQFKRIIKKDGLRGLMTRMKSEARQGRS